jgi:hypothetical protein
MLLVNIFGPLYADKYFGYIGTTGRLSASVLEFIV